MNKRASFIQENLGAIILLVITAGILIFFAANLFGFVGEEVDKDTCHTSVMLRSQESIVKEATQRIFPLRCKTEDKCLTMGGKCPEGYSKVDVKDENEIKKEVANAMYYCWWMLGEGKVNFIGRPLLENERSCVICSKISFSDVTKQRVSTVNNFFDYIMNAQVPIKNITYLEFFSQNKQILKDESMPTISTSQDYWVVYVLSEKTQITKAVPTGTGCLASLFTGVKVGIAVSAAIPVVGVIAGPLAGAGITMGGCYASWKGSNEIDKLVTSNSPYFSSMYLMPSSAETISQLGCKSIESIP